MIFASIVILTIAHNCRAFSYDDIESIDDIYHYYYSGQIDQAQFEYLLELFDFGRLSYEDILAMGIAQPAESFSRNDSLSNFGIYRLVGQARLDKIGLRVNFGRDTNRAGNYYLNFCRNSAEYRIKMQSKDRDYFCNNRAIKISHDSIAVELGNYLVSEGYGLTIGRFDYQPSAGYQRDYEFDFWTPVNSYYNGIKTEFRSGKYSGRFYSSIKHYDNTKKRFAGGAISFKQNYLIIGLSAGYNNIDINNSENTRMAEGINVTYNNRNYLIGGEIAQVKRNIGFYFTGAGNNDYGSLAIDFWHYARHFENYNCSGKAASDYHSFYPTLEPIGFRTAQAGETGGAIRFARNNLAFGYQAWKQVDKPELNMLVSARHRMGIGDFATIANQVEYSVKKDRNAFWWKNTFSNMPIKFLQRLGLKLESDHSGIKNDDSYGFLTFGANYSEDVIFYTDIRGHFDGDWSSIITEKVYMYGDFYFDLEIVFSNNWRANAIIERAL